jgi:hypothetical protein
LDEQETSEQLRIMSKEQAKTGLDLKAAQIAGGALAAVTAAYLGSKLNVAGTITGAAVASVVSTIGAALYQRSIERTRESVRKVGNKAWVIRPADGESLKTNDVVVAAEAEADAPAGIDSEIDSDKTHKLDKPPTEARKRWPVVAVGALLAFVIGMLAITGIEWARGGPLSGGDQGTSLGVIVGKPTERPQQTPAPSPSQTFEPAPTTTTQPSGSSSSTPSTTPGSSVPSTTAPPSSATPSSTGQPSATPSTQTPLMPSAGP